MEAIEDFIQSLHHQQFRATHEIAIHRGRLDEQIPVRVRSWFNLDLEIWQTKQATGIGAAIDFAIELVLDTDLFVPLHLFRLGQLIVG